MAPLDLVLTNPNRFAVRVVALSARLGVSTTKPRCDAEANYAVRAVSPAAYPLRLRSGSTRLSALVAGSSLWPRVSMHDLPTNQDACRGAVRVARATAARRRDDGSAGLPLCAGVLALAPAAGERPRRVGVLERLRDRRRIGHDGVAGGDRDEPRAGDRDEQRDGDVERTGSLVPSAGSQQPRSRTPSSAGSTAARSPPP